MHFDGLIFDLDGTLWNCSRASANAFNRVYEIFKINRRVTSEFIESISGRPSSECEAILLDSVPIDVQQEVSRSFNEFESAAVQEHAPAALYPGVTQGLETLKFHYRLFVVSNCSERYLRIFHRHTPIGGIFSGSECFGRTGKLKNENIRTLTERHSLSSPCYIGDTAGDEEAAAKAGVPFFHASYGFGRPAGEPTAFVTFVELTTYFKELARLKAPL